MFSLLLNTIKGHFWLKVTGGFRAAADHWAVERLNENMKNENEIACSSIYYNYHQHSLDDPHNEVSGPICKIFGMLVDSSNNPKVSVFDEWGSKINFLTNWTFCQFLRKCYLFHRSTKVSLMSFIVNQGVCLRRDWSFSPQTYWFFWMSFSTINAPTTMSSSLLSIASSQQTHDMLLACSNFH